MNGDLARIELVSDVEGLRKFAVTEDKIWIDSQAKTLAYKYHYSYEKDGEKLYTAKPENGGKILVDESSPFTFSQWDSYPLQAMMDAGAQTMGDAIRSSIYSYIASIEDTL